MKEASSRLTEATLSDRKARLFRLSPERARRGLTVAANAPKAPVRNVVLVHGAWADGSSWAKVIPILEKAGLHVVAVQNPPTSLADDVATVQRAIALEDGPVILVGHSYGGAVITEAGRRSQGRRPRLRGSIRAGCGPGRPRSRQGPSARAGRRRDPSRQGRLPEDHHEGHRRGFRAGPAESGPQDSRCDARSHEWLGLRSQGHQRRMEVKADLVRGRRQRSDDPTGPRAAIRQDDGGEDDHRRVQPRPHAVACARSRAPDHRRRQGRAGGLMLYLEDFAPGPRYVSGRLRVDEVAIK